MYGEYDPTIWNTWSNTQEPVVTAAPSSSTWDSLVNTLGSIVQTGVKTYGDIYKSRYCRDMRTVPSNQSGLIIERTGYPVDRMPQTGITTRIPVQSSFLAGISQTHLMIGIGVIVFLIFMMKGIK